MTAPYEIACGCGRIILRRRRDEMEPIACARCDAKAAAAGSQMDLFQRVGQCCMLPTCRRPGGDAELRSS